MPFGLSATNSELLDVSDVPRGKNCGCSCPSCNTPLIARQGNEKQWHFAHASRAVYNDTKNKCEFSFFVSVRMMARQIIENSLKIMLPEYIDYESQHSHGKQFIVPFKITSKQEITISDTEIEKKFLGAPVDVFGKVNAYSFILYFTHPGKEVPVEFNNPSNSKCGIVSISLDSIYALFETAKKQQKSYKEILYSFLKNDISSKKWIFHPRYESLKKLAVNDLNREIEVYESQLKKTASRKAKKKKTSHKFIDDIISMDCNESSGAELSQKKIFKEQPKRLGNYECIMCHSQWQGYDQGANPCPKCKTHLYRRLLSYV